MGGEHFAQHAAQPRLAPLGGKQPGPVRSGFLLLGGVFGRGARAGAFLCVVRWQVDHGFGLGVVLQHGYAMHLAQLFHQRRVPQQMHGRVDAAHRFAVGAGHVGQRGALARIHEQQHARRDDLFAFHAVLRQQVDPQQAQQRGQPQRNQ